MVRKNRQISASDALFLQGGGALGAYEWGAWEALEEKGLDFSLISGVSIGAVNAAIVASRGKEASTYLGRFWENAADPLADTPMLLSPKREEMAAAKSVLFGNPAMFVPIWMKEPFSMLQPNGSIAFYDSAPMRSLVEKNVDFKALKSSGRGLLVGAVDTESGNLTLFDSKDGGIDLKHVMASCALPPAFPPVAIGGRYYWDGGLVSNAPLRRILRRMPKGALRRLLFVELFPRHHRLPENMKEVFQVLKDFSYMNRNDIERERHAEAREIASLVNRILNEDPHLAKLCSTWPEFRKMAEEFEQNTRLFTISHIASAEDEASRDADFSPSSLKKRRNWGRKAALEAIQRWEKEPDWRPFTCQSGDH